MWLLLIDCMLLLDKVVTHTLVLLLNPLNNHLNMTIKSLSSLKEKQMQQYNYMGLICIHLGDGLGSRGFPEPCKSHFSLIET